MRVNITGPENLFRPTLPNGDPNPLWAYVTLAASRGLFVQAPDIGGTARLNDVSADIVTPDLALSILALGGDVENYSRWIVVPDASANVTAGIPQATVTDEGNETPRTWADWHGPNHSHIEINGTTYVSTHAWGTDLLMSQQKALTDAGLTLITKDELLALMPAPEPDPE